MKQIKVIIDDDVLSALKNALVVAGLLFLLSHMQSFTQLKIAFKLKGIR